mgnify:FL=1
MKNLKLGFILEGAILMALFVFSLMEFAFGHSILGFVWLFLAVLNAIYIYKSKDDDYDLEYEVKLKELDNALYKDRRAFEIELEFRLLKAKQEFNKNIIKEPLTGEKQATSYNEADLVGFGNYLLSNKREEFYKQNKSSLPLKDRLKQVNDTDLKNYFN